jgi:glycosyltransferase involved in cell wall biosynthesis
VTMRVLLIAYACEPAEGSEPGAGWAFARMLASVADVCVITRANNRESIEREVGSVPESGRLHFVYVDLPARARFWKRGRIGIQPYYLLWQRSALRAGRALHREAPFDLVWHVTLANTWLGSVGGLIGPDFVWGPIGGGVDAPPRMAPALGVRGSVYEAIRWGVRAAFRLANPLARVGWRRARLVLTQNPETLRWLPARYRAKARVFPNVALGPTEARWAPLSGDRDRTALFAGNLFPLKGLSLAIDALGDLPDWRLVLAGSGPDEARLRRIAERRGVADRVEFLGRIPRARVLELLTRCDVFVFPSLRDDAGWAVAEAVRAGIPVVCLDRGGPSIIAGASVPITTPTRTARHLAAAIREAPARSSTPLDVSFEGRRRALLDILSAAGIPFESADRR